MSGKWLLLAVTWCATLLAVSAVAQDEKNELGGTFGHAFISDQSITGATFFNSGHAFRQRMELRRGVCQALSGHTAVRQFPVKWWPMYNPGRGFKRRVCDQPRCPHPTISSSL